MKYRSNEPGKAGKTALDVYELDDIDSITSGNLLMEQGGDGPVAQAHSYAYRIMRCVGKASASLIKDLDVIVQHAWPDRPARQ